MGLENPSLPLNVPIHGGLPDNARVDIYCDPIKGSEHHFVIEFLSTQGVAFHMDVRMGYQKEHEIVMNSMHNGTWDKEKRHSSPFKHNHNYHITIEHKKGGLLGHQHFSIHVAGKHLADFNNRLPNNSINAFVIRGDLRVQNVSFDHFNEALSTPQPNQPYPQQPNQPYSAYPQPGAGGFAPQPSFPGQGFPQQPYPNQPFPNQPFPGSAGMPYGEFGGGHQHIGDGGERFDSHPHPHQHPHQHPPHHPHGGPYGGAEYDITIRREF